MSCTRHVLSCTHVLVMYSVVKKSQRRFPWITGFSQALGSRLCFAQTNYPSPAANPPLCHNATPFVWFKSAGHHGHHVDR